MKKTVFLLMTAVLCVAACQESEEMAPIVSDDVLSAQIEQDEMTKTVLGESNNILWSENDQIIAFMKRSYGYKYQIKSSFVGKTYADFSRISSASGDDISAGIEWDHIVAYYPYSETIECKKSEDDYVLDVILPSEQTYVAESFANGSFPMVAVSEDNDIVFKNVCGGIKLQLKGTQNVVSIILQGKNSEKLSGTGAVTAYTDETKPAIVMSDEASTSVTLNCGEGVQLNESTATEFIIALPPVLFSQGFTVTITDSESETYTVETDKANTVLRSSLLVMPTVKVAETPEVEGDDDESVVPVGSVKLNKSSLTLPPSFTYALTAKITPIDATVQSATWSSSDASVATVDQNGVVVAVSDGTATITAEAGGETATCTFTVIAPTSELSDYVDEYGVNHGKGIALGDKVWAPVNCGYHSTDFPYGKHYQWGRKYGQGLSGSYDSSTVTVLEGPISSVNGQKEAYADYFFSVSEFPYDWLSTQDGALWNSGTEESPLKTENDPCPKGWRVPTRSELSQLAQNHSGRISSEDGMYFSGDYSYIDGVPRLILPTSGYRGGYDGGGLTGVGGYGRYWSVTSNSKRAYYLSFNYLGEVNSSLFDDRANGYAVRCLQE